MRRRQRTTQMLIITVVSHTMCCVPFNVYTVLQYMHQGKFPRQGKNTSKTALKRHFDLFFPQKLHAGENDCTKLEAYIVSNSNFVQKSISLITFYYRWQKVYKWTDNHINETMMTLECLSLNANKKSFKLYLRTKRSQGLWVIYQLYCFLPRS